MHKLRKQKDAKPKNSVAIVTITVPDFDKLFAETKTLLDRSIVSQTLDELKEDSEIGSWVQRGLALHTGDRRADACRFCGQPLPVPRREALEAHFNDAFAAFQNEIVKATRLIEQHRDRLASQSFPALSRFYDHMNDEAKAALDVVERAIKSGVDSLDSLLVALHRKKDAPFEPITLEGGKRDSEHPTRKTLLDEIEAVNAIIEKHNRMTEDFQSQVEDACRELEECYVAEAFSDYSQLRKVVTSAELALQAVVDTPKQIEDEIAQIEHEIVEHLTPAEELNDELRAYLGRDELEFKVRETGYTLTRSGHSVSHLSEGETTAIAFLYFLKSLKDKSFDLSRGVVVVDDPVSSLDANSLFSAFGYMKERTKDCGQLFVLTHNFGFFRQVKNWFHHLPTRGIPRAERPQGRFFLMRACADSGGQRTAVLGQLDTLLREHESEYHYLFKCVHAEAQQDDEEVDLEHYYGIPNIARRLLETFLAFRYPYPPENLRKRLARVEFDPSRKIRILQLLHTYSHSGDVGVPEHDPTVLSETRQVLRDVLAMMETADPTHYAGMAQAVGVEPEVAA